MIILKIQDNPYVHCPLLKEIGKNIGREKEIDDRMPVTCCRDICKHGDIDWENYDVKCNYEDSRKSSNPLTMR